MKMIPARLTALILFFLPVQLAASIITTYNDSNPVTNAGSLPGSSLNLIGLYPEAIYGNLGRALNAVNVFAISILQPINFSAFTVNGGAHYAPDTELFLLDFSGRAVYGNDDLSASDTFSCLPSGDGLNPCPTTSAFRPITAGTYYLAITRSAQMPYDNLSNYLFTMAADSSSVLGPDFTAGGANPIAGWDGMAYNNPDFDNTYYEIVLTGTVPEPGTFLLLTGAGACAAVWSIRKRAVGQNK